MYPSSQAFVLANAVTALQLCTTKYLDAISGGELTLELSLQDGEASPYLYPWS